MIRHRRMVRAKCVQCGKEFATDVGRKTCSNECKKERKRLQDLRCKAGNTVLGTTKTCQHCGNQFVVTGTTQKYCTSLCQSRAKSDYEREKNIPRVCEVCGVDFFTNSSVMARTCGKECAHVLRVSRMVASAAANPRFTNPSVPEYQMPCPWASGYMTTLPAHGVLWQGPEADPMSWGAHGVQVNIQHVEEAAA